MLRPGVQFFSFKQPAGSLIKFIRFLYYICLFLDSEARGYFSDSPGLPEIFAKTTVFASLDAEIIVKTTVFASLDTELIVKTTVFASLDAEMVAKTTVFRSLGAENIAK